MLTLRDYQSDAIESLRSEIGKGLTSLICQAATGAGKTVIACSMIARASAKGKSALFLASGRELVDQTSATLTSIGVHHGIIMAGERPSYATVQVASKETLSVRALKMNRMDLPHADLVVPDEIQESMARGWQQLLGHYRKQGSIIVGLSATPAREDGRSLGDFWQKIVTVSSYERLITEGHLVPSRVFAPHVPNLKAVKKTKTDWVLSELSAAVDKPKLVGNVVDTWRALASDRLTIVFATDVAHALHLRAEFLMAGIPTEHIDQHTSVEERREIKRRLQAGLTRVVTTVGVYRRGVDIPEVSCVVLARPTRSYVLYRQMTGRGMRSFPGKQDLLVLDHAGAVFMHGFPDVDIEWTLEPSDNIHRRAKERLQPTEKKPIRCPQCYAVFFDKRICPNCQYVLEKQAKGQRSQRGKLFEIGREGTMAPSFKEQQQRTWTQCVAIAVKKGLPIGAAAHMFRRKYGEFPKGPMKYMPEAGQWKRLASELFPQFQGKVKEV